MKLRKDLRRLLRLGMRADLMWGIADQGLFGVTSFALSVGIADRATAREFGVFGICYVIYTVILGGLEAFTAEVLVVRSSHLLADEQHAMLEGASGTAVAVGSVLSVIGFVFLGFGSGGVAQVIPPLFIAAPLLFAQDVWRFGFFASSRPRSATLNDILWGVLLAVGFAIVLRTGATHSAAELEWCWSGAGATCGVVGAVQSRCVPKPNRLISWVRTELRSGGRFATEFLAMYAAGQSVLLWVGILAGLRQSAGYRGATLLFGPIQIMLNAARLAVIPLLARKHHAGSHNAALIGGAALAACACLATLAWGAVVLSLPVSVGSHILGASWSRSRQIVPVILWQTAALGIGLGAIVFMRVIGAYKETFRTRVAGAILLFSLGAAGASQGPAAAGAGAGLAVTCVTGALWWQALRFLRLSKKVTPATTRPSRNVTTDGASRRDLDTDARP